MSAFWWIGDSEIQKFVEASNSIHDHANNGSKLVNTCTRKIHLNGRAALIAKSRAGCSSCYGRRPNIHIELNGHEGSCTWHIKPNGETLVARLATEEMLISRYWKKRLTVCLKGVHKIRGETHVTKRFSIQAGCSFSVTWTISWSSGKKQYWHWPLVPGVFSIRMSKTKHGRYPSSPPSRDLTFPRIESNTWMLM